MKRVVAHLMSDRFCRKEVCMKERENPSVSSSTKIPEDLERCIVFHGHICPGLVYGYLVAKEAIRLLGLRRSSDEEVVAVPENDSCAVDALQVLLGTTAGKGNLILKNYGKNAFTVIKRGNRRTDGQAFRFARKTSYRYEGPDAAEFQRLDEKISGGNATGEEKKRQRLLKALDLLNKGFDGVFTTEEVPVSEPPLAPLAPSAPCARCGEMTMATRLVEAPDGSRHCLPCAEKKGIAVSP